MQPLFKIKTILPHMFVRTQILVDIPKILQIFFYYCIKKWDFGEILAPKS
jgi:hypothetical protein